MRRIAETIGMVATMVVAATVATTLITIVILCDIIERLMKGHRNGG